MSGRGEGGYRDPASREPDEPPPDPRGAWVLQTWASRLVCPDCGTALWAARRDGYRIEACGTCGGAWTAHDVMSRELAAVITARVKRASPTDPEAERYLEIVRREGIRRPPEGLGEIPTAREMLFMVLDTVLDVVTPSSGTKADDEETKKKR